MIRHARALGPAPVVDDITPTCELPSLDIEWWDAANENAHRAAALCRSCPTLQACTVLSQKHRPFGVVQAARIWPEFGDRRVPLGAGWLADYIRTCAECGIRFTADGNVDHCTSQCRRVASDRIERAWRLAQRRRVRRQKQYRDRRKQVAA